MHWPLYRAGGALVVVLALVVSTGCSARRSGDGMAGKFSTAGNPASPGYRPAQYLNALDAASAPAHQAVMPAAAPNDHSIVRVMSFNLRVATLIDTINHWGFRRSLVVKTIRSFDPDLLGTQECLAGQADFLRSELPDYEFFGVGRSNGRRRGEMCGIFYKADRFQRLDGGHFWLSEEPERAGSRGWGAMWPRMVTWVKLQPRTTRGGGASTGQPLFLFNTHFDVFSSSARTNSAHLLRQRIASIADGAPNIVTGDFNTTEDSNVYRALVARHPEVGPPMQDVYRAVQPKPSAGEGTRHSFRGSRNGPRIDWIMASSGHFNVLNAAIDHTRAGARYPSDHFPVTAVLRVTATPPKIDLAQIE